MNIDVRKKDSDEIEVIDLYDYIIRKVTDEQDIKKLIIRLLWNLFDGSKSLIHKELADVLTGGEEIITNHKKDQ